MSFDMKIALRPTIHDIEQAVRERFHLTKQQIRFGNTKRSYARPRQIVMFLAHSVSGMAYAGIGRHYDRDHSTVIKACQRIPELMLSNPKIRDHVHTSHSDALRIAEQRKQAAASWVERLHRGEISWPLQEAAE